MKRDNQSPTLHVFLIKPSKYDDDGFVMRHWKGVLPSNTLACLHGLTEDVRARKLLGDVDKWLQTRKRSESELRVIEELSRMRRGLRRSLRISELQAAYERAKARMPSIEVPSRLSLLRKKLSVVQVSKLRETRHDLSIYWTNVRRRIRRGRLEVLLRMDRMALNLLREVRVTTAFLIALATGAS